MRQQILDACWVLSLAACAAGCRAVDDVAMQKARVESALEKGMSERDVRRIAGPPTREQVGGELDDDCRSLGGRKEAIYEYRAPRLWGLLGTYDIGHLVVCFDDAPRLVSVTRIIF